MGIKMKVIALVILVSLLSLGQATDPDADIQRTLCEVVVERKLVCQEHTVLTTDGYILKMHRIPGKLNTPQEQKPVIYIQHGILDSSDAFVYNDDDNSLATVLAEAGYDVWLGNNRGNKYSLGHQTLTNHFWNEEYWSFSFQEMGLRDVPSMIDYIQTITGVKTLVYIGHSEGTSQMFAALSDPIIAPKIQDKVSLFISLAPVIRLDNAAGLLKTLSNAHAGEVLKGAHVYETLWANPTLMGTLSWICKEVESLCLTIGQLVGQLDPSATSWPRARVLLSKFPCGASTVQFVHYEQIIRSQRFQKYDYGTSMNIRIYGSADPPLWDISKIKVPMIWYTAGQDVFADPADVAISREILKSTAMLKKVLDVPSIGHLGFMWSNVSSTTYMPDLLTQVKRYALL